MQLQRGWFRTAPKLTRRQKNTSIIREQGTTDRGNYFKDQQYKVDACSTLVHLLSCTEEQGQHAQGWLSTCHTALFFKASSDAHKRAKGI